jgi:broad specificity phosphatase PhoE
MRLYFVRHGESECNLTWEFSNTGVKHPLTAKGVQQAHTLAARLAEAGDVRKVYTSPLLRARQTAHIMGDTLHVPVEETDALREFSAGVLEGRSDPAAWDIYHAVGATWLARQDWAQRIEGGESVLDMRARFMPLIAEITQTYHNQLGALVLVGHGGLYIWMLPLVLTNLDYDFTTGHRILNTAHVVAEWTPDGWRCTEWCGEPLR